MGRLVVLRLKKKREQPRRSVGQSPVNRPRPTYYGNEMPRKEDSVRARLDTKQKLNLWKQVRLIPTLLAILAILLSVAYNTTLTTTPGIIFANDASVYRKTTEYKTGIAKILESSLFNRSKFTINTSSTSAAIAKAYPELDAVSIGLPIIGRRPTVTLHLRKPALILTTKTNALVLDTNGKVVAEAKQLISSVSSGLLTVQDQTGLELHVGDQALTTDTVTFITNVGVQLASKQLTISGITLPNGGNEIDIKVKDLAYYLKTDSTGDPRIEIGDFLAARDNGVSPSEYMDVRVEGKVFYK